MGRQMMADGITYASPGEIMMALCSSTKMEAFTCTAGVSKQDTLLREEVPLCWVESKIQLQADLKPISPSKAP